jgi:anaerobic magnesium-protoporphyrin IX monomethyl ester cyclase
MAKITLIRIPNVFAAGALTLSAVPPIFMTYLGSSLRKGGYDVAVIDSVGEAIEQVYTLNNQNLYANGLTIDEILNTISDDSKYIGVSFPFSHEWPHGRILCEAIKAKFPDSILICGGEHITAMPEFSLNSCRAIDYLVLGEGEETIVALLDTLEAGGAPADVAGISFLDASGEMVKTENRSRLIEIDEISEPAWDLIPLEIYLSGGYSFGVNIGRTIPLIATRGCPFECTFCSNPFMWTTRWLARKPINVVNEMEKYIRDYNVENFDFYDLTAIVRKDWIVEFCQLLIDRKLNITWQLPSGTRSEALDKEVTDLLYQSGCRNLSYAPESGSPETLKLIKKKIKLDDMLESMKYSISSNINIKANVIVGFPNERLGNIFETYKLIVRMAVTGVADVGVWTFSAYPGSELFDDLTREKQLPEFTDDYFTSLLSYSDLKNVVSWNKNFSNWQLKYLRLFGLVLFYMVSYTISPIRLVRNIRNILNHKPQSRLEMIVEKAIRRHKKDPQYTKTAGA